VFPDKNSIGNHHHQRGITQYPVQGKIVFHGPNHHAGSRCNIEDHRCGDKPQHPFCSPLVFVFLDNKYRIKNKRYVNKNNTGNYYCAHKIPLKKTIKKTGNYCEVGNIAVLTEL
jgi:hypothetical protein